MLYSQARGTGELHVGPGPKIWPKVTKLIGAELDVNGRGGKQALVHRVYLDSVCGASENSIVTKQ